MMQEGIAERDGGKEYLSTQKQSTHGLSDGKKKAIKVPFYCTDESSSLSSTVETRPSSSLHSLSSTQEPTVSAHSAAVSPFMGTRETIRRKRLNILPQLVAQQLSPTPEFSVAKQKEQRPTGGNRRALTWLSSSSQSSASRTRPNGNGNRRRNTCTPLSRMAVSAPPVLPCEELIENVNDNKDQEGGDNFGTDLETNVDDFLFLSLLGGEKQKIHKQIHPNNCGSSSFNDNLSRVRSSSSLLMRTPPQSLRKSSSTMSMESERGWALPTKNGAWDMFSEPGLDQSLYGSPSVIGHKSSMTGTYLGASDKNIFESPLAQSSSLNHNAFASSSMSWKTPSPTCQNLPTHQRYGAPSFTDILPMKVLNEQDGTVAMAEKEIVASVSDGEDENMSSIHDDTVKKMQNLQLKPSPPSMHCSERSMAVTFQQDPKLSLRNGDAFALVKEKRYNIPHGEKPQKQETNHLFVESILSNANHVTPTSKKMAASSCFNVYSPPFQVTSPTLSTTLQACSKFHFSTPSRKFRGRQQQVLTPKESGNKRQGAIYFSPNPLLVPSTRHASAMEAKVTAGKIISPLFSPRKRLLTHWKRKDPILVLTTHARRKQVFPSLSGAYRPSAQQRRIGTEEKERDRILPKQPRMNAFVKDGLVKVLDEGHDQKINYMRQNCDITLPSTGLTRRRQQLSIDKTSPAVSSTAASLSSHQLVFNKSRSPENRLIAHSSSDVDMSQDENKFSLELPQLKFEDSNEYDENASSIDEFLEENKEGLCCAFTNNNDGKNECVLETHVPEVKNYETNITKVIDLTEAANFGNKEEIVGTLISNFVATPTPTTSVAKRFNDKKNLEYKEETFGENTADSGSVYQDFTDGVQSFAVTKNSLSGFKSKNKICSNQHVTWISSIMSSSSDQISQGGVKKVMETNDLLYINNELAEEKLSTPNKCRSVLFTNSVGELNDNFIMTPFGSPPNVAFCTPQSQQQAQLFGGLQAEDIASKQTARLLLPALSLTDSCPGYASGPIAIDIGCEGTENGNDENIGAVNIPPLALQMPQSQKNGLTNHGTKVTDLHLLSERCGEAISYGSNTIGIGSNGHEGDAGYKLGTNRNGFDRSKNVKKKKKLLLSRKRIIYLSP